MHVWVNGSTGWNGVLGFKAVMWDAAFMLLIVCEGLLLKLCVCVYILQTYPKPLGPTLNSRSLP